MFVCKVSPKRHTTAILAFNNSPYLLCKSFINIENIGTLLPAAVQVLRDPAHHK